MNRTSERLIEIGKMLGRTVKTPQGEGILIAVYTPSNSLYYIPDSAALIVWYGSEHIPGPTVLQHSFSEISLITDEPSE